MYGKMLGTGIEPARPEGQGILSLIQMKNKDIP